MKRRVIIAVHDDSMTMGKVFKWLNDIKYDTLWGYGSGGKFGIRYGNNSAFIDITGKSLKIDIYKDEA